MPPSYPECAGPLAARGSGSTNICSVFRCIASTRKRYGAKVYVCMFHEHVHGEWNPLENIEKRNENFFSPVRRGAFKKFCAIFMNTDYYYIHDSNNACSIHRAPM